MIARGAGARLERLFESIGARIQEELAQPVFQRDPEFITRCMPVFERFARYFRAEVRGFEHVPDGTPSLLVGNHSGGLYMPDMFAFAASWFRERGVHYPIYALGHSLLFTMPTGPYTRKLGGIPASVENAEYALDRGSSLVVYPGGDYEVFRPWSHRNRIDFGNRNGFVKLALRKRVPVVPIVSHGSHESTIVLARGERIARKLGLERMRVKICPLVLGLPWGIAPGFIPTLPLPAKITVQLCPPIDWSRYGPEAADDPTIVQRCYDEILSVMQKMMDRLVAENPHPLWRRGARAGAAGPNGEAVRETLELDTLLLEESERLSGELEPWVAAGGLRRGGAPVYGPGRPGPGGRLEPLVVMDAM